MKILVAIKRVIDPYVKIRVNTDQTGVETSNVKMSTNPFCEIALEEAVRLKESGAATEVVVISIGDERSRENLLGALALGADRALHVPLDTSPQPLAVAKILHAVAKKEQVSLTILGKQSIDSDNNQVAQMLAAVSDQPQGTFASKLEVSDGHLLVTREVDGGLETLRLVLPAVVSTDLRLNEPRYASLPHIMKAKKKPLEVITCEELGVEVSSGQQILSVMAPEKRKEGERLTSVEQLVDRLKNQAKVI